MVCFAVLNLSITHKFPAGQVGVLHTLFLLRYLPLLNYAHEQEYKHGFFYTGCCKAIDGAVLLLRLFPPGCSYRRIM